MELSLPLPWGWVVRGEEWGTFQSSVFLKVVPRPVASASPGNLFEMQMFRLHCTSTESGIQELSPGNVCFNKHSGNSDALQSLRVILPSPVGLVFRELSGQDEKDVTVDCLGQWWPELD